MNYLQDTVKKTNAYIWYVGILFSVALLSLVVYQSDVTLYRKVFNSISWVYFVISIFVLLLEGLFTALRFKLFTPGNPSLKSCLKVTSFFIVSLIILPARLGEIAVIFLLKSHLGQRTGPSIMNVLTQRFIDLIFLCTLLFIFVFINKSIAHNLYIYIGIFSAISILLLSIFKLDILLGFVASLFFTKNSLTKNNLFRKIFRMVIQARMWHRFHMNKNIISKAIVISVAKWGCNIGGLTLLFYSFNVPLNEFQLLLTSTAYNLLAIIPLQTIGGFGISEAGLTGILIFFGLPIDLSASISIMCRIVLISTPFLFFLLVYSYLFYTQNEKCS